MKKRELNRIKLELLINKQRLHDLILYEGLMIIHPYKKRMIVVTRIGNRYLTYQFFGSNLYTPKPKNIKVKISIFKRWYREYLKKRIKELKGVLKNENRNI